MFHSHDFLANDAPIGSKFWEALYQRARAALVAQLRDAELVREEASLEIAIRKVEAQYAPPPKPVPEGVTPIAPLARKGRPQ